MDAVMGNQEGQARRYSETCPFLFETNTNHFVPADCADFHGLLSTGRFEQEETEELWHM